MPKAVTKLPVTILRGGTSNSNEENNKMFRDLFLLSVANVAINVLLSALGLFSLGGLFY